MSRSLKSTLNGQGRFKIPEKFRLKIPQRGFGCCAIRNGFHKSFITNDLAWAYTFATPWFDKLTPGQTTPWSRPACLVCLCFGRQAASRRSHHDA